MSVTAAPPLPWWQRPPILLAVTLAQLLAHRPPERIRATLSSLRRGARPATYAQAQQARNQVLAASIHCAGEGCLQRSVATALLCRLRGHWPTWCVGVRTQPFGAHAWVEAEGRAVDEPHPDDYYRPIITVR
ncbi:lasso peptide biosynthesis B2 protein [Nocardia panacis]|uniref:Lasso peptide biosynthesis B2 protein n=2 Tax=Nocardia panacis TaxID=2340916 RepID=A0A3A4KT63_9NOCA|nr:lasso peptide biosynthesis B2 protein [Nocardia panacis]